MRTKTAAMYEELKTPCQTSLVFDTIFPQLEGKRVLDAGCATGDYLARLSGSSLGLEYSNANLDICKRKGLRVVKADLNEGLPVENGSFDAVLCSHVIEHVDSPFALLREMHRVVRRGGTVVLSYPVEKSLARFFMRDDFFKNHPTHLYSFSPDCIKRLVEKAGFSVERMLLDFPLLKRFRLTTALNMMQHMPRKVGFLCAGNVWVIGRKN